MAQTATEVAASALPLPRMRVESATVDGACTNCWAMKRPGPSGFAPQRTERVWARDGSGLGLWTAIGGGTALLAIAVLAVIVLSLDLILVAGGLVVILVAVWAVLAALG